MLSLRYAPLLPFAVAATLAIVVDRYLGFAVLSWLITSCVGVAIWLAAFKRNELLAQCGLWICCLGMAGAHHHHQRNDYAANDIGNVAHGTATAYSRHADEEPTTIMQKDNRHRRPQGISRRRFSTSPRSNREACGRPARHA
jgi:competence protein ComEC